MSMSQGREVESDEIIEGETIVYRKVSPLAIASLLLGLTSLLAIVFPLLWAFPLLGAGLSLLALWQVAAAKEAVVGRKAALLGLVLSIASATAIPVQQLSARWWLGSDARQIADQWFEALRHGDPFMAHELSLPVSQRMHIKTELSQYLGGRPVARQAFEGFLSIPVVRTLLALNDKAEVRLYDVENLETDSESGADLVDLVYAVTFDEGGEKKSFFVRMTCERAVNPDSGRGLWRVLKFSGGVRPTTAPK